MQKLEPRISAVNPLNLEVYQDTIISFLIKYSLTREHTCELTRVQILEGQLGTTGIARKTISSTLTWRMKRRRSKLMRPKWLRMWEMKIVLKQLNLVKGAVVKGTRIE
jgi:hypothetical protein